MIELRPTDAEKQFLDLAYNRFYDIFEEVTSNDFLEKDAWYRLSRARDLFGVYAELLKYEPITWVIERLRKTRPPMEAEIAGDLFRFIRHLVSHFPFFNSWDEIAINKGIVNWTGESGSIDKLLQKYEGHKQVKYRFWETAKKRMTYLSINFPQGYSQGGKVFLKEIISEREGVRFAAFLMKNILDTQVEAS